MYTVYAVKWTKDGTYLLLGDEQSSITVNEEDCTACHPTYTQDINGKEIYTGDIVEVTESDDWTLYDVVIFHKGRFNLDYFGESLDHYKIEIKGNFYENPELLEQ
ncbi:YopX family protein [Phocoenobacter skyensis]|nr:YopX family protein [Pasteurella skyensis]MDP8184358.1 YopX family protein [Pasteurella skyensis]